MSLCGVYMSSQYNSSMSISSFFSMCCNSLTLLLEWTILKAGEMLALLAIT